MLDSNTLVIIAILIGSVGGLIYIKQTLTGSVKPNRVTYFFWGLLPIIGFLAELDKGVGLIAYYTLLGGLIPFLIFLTSFLNKEAYWRLGSFDYFMGGMAIIGVTLWQLTGDGNLAIVFAITADAAAGIPTIRKSYKEPETENIISYFLAAIAAIITMCAIPIWDFAHYGFPAYFLFFNTSIVLAVILGRRRSAKPNSY